MKKILINGKNFIILINTIHIIIIIGKITSKDIVENILLNF